MQPRRVECAACRGSHTAETGHLCQPRPHWGPPVPEVHTLGVISKCTQDSRAVSSLTGRDTAHDVSGPSSTVIQYSCRQKVDHNISITVLQICTSAHCGGAVNIIIIIMFMHKILAKNVFYTCSDILERNKRSTFSKCLIYFPTGYEKKRLNIDRGEDNRSVTVATAQ